MGELFDFAEPHFLACKLRIKTVNTARIQRRLVNGGPLSNPSFDQIGKYDTLIKRVKNGTGLFLVIKLVLKNTAAELA